MLKPLRQYRSYHLPRSIQPGAACRCACVAGLLLIAMQAIPAVAADRPRLSNRAPDAPPPAFGAAAGPVDRPLPPPVIRRVDGTGVSGRPVLQLQVTPPPQLSQSPPPPPPVPPAIPQPAPPADPAPPAPAQQFSVERLNAGDDIRPLRDTSIDLHPASVSPENPAANVFVNAVDLRAPHGWIAPMGSGHTACVGYKPLYFEEINLERYGYHCGCLQPVMSAAHFYGTLPLLPYKMAHKPPCSCEVNLQYPPAATCAQPVRWWKRPIDPKAVVVEAAVVAGAILLFP